MTLQPRDVQLLIYPDFDGYPDGFRESLMKEGYSTEEIDSLDQLCDKAVQYQKPILMINAGDKKTPSTELINDILSKPVLAEIPMLFSGRSGEMYEKVFARKFSELECISFPVKRTEVIFALKGLLKRYPFTPSEIEEKTKEKPSHRLSETHIALTDEDLPTLMFSQMTQLGEEEYGGAHLGKSMGIEELRALGILPENEAIQQEVIRIQAMLDSWTSGHICRTSFISNSFHEALAIPAEQAEKTKEAALLLPLAAERFGRSLFRQNYITCTDGVRHKLASKLKDSALQVMTDLNDPDVSRVISLVARYVGGEDQPRDSIEHLSASLLTAAELIDRVCFEKGHWDPRSAHFLIRAATDGKLDFLHPLSAASMMKFISEALQSLPQVFLVASKFREDDELLEKAQENANYEPTEEEKKVAITSLEPGMRLSKPIYAFDGRKILSGKILLDQDLIWRLWRLSAVRTMNTPVIVERKDFEA